VYIFTKEILQARKNRIGARPLLFEIPRHEAWDIDEEIDFRIAEFLARDHHPL
jgi:CMP-N-acetylneuraminic acid synthetase